MNILITGANGFLGKNLLTSLENIRDGKDRTWPELRIDKIFPYTRQDSPESLRHACQEADFIFHLAGVNRPQDPEEYRSGNTAFTAELLTLLENTGKACTVMFASSVQAELKGRFADSAYGQSKRDAEDLLFRFGEKTGNTVLVYRFPNLFGKWCRPHYNSVVATFCHQIARDLPIRMDNPDTVLELAYVDDVVAELLRALMGKAQREGRFCRVPVTHRVTLGEIEALLHRFHEQPHTLEMPELPAGSFAKKLYSTYLSYLPAEKLAFPLPMHVDERGSFTELLRTASCGQFSVNISKPGITKGQHWHHSKWEFFMVVSGHGRIQERRIGSDEVLTVDVSGEKLEAVHMLPGFTHNLINLSDTEDLVTLMWANECFDPSHPDTYAEPV